MKKTILNRAVYIFLIPVFFVLHGYAENFGLVTVADCLWLVSSYFIAAICIHLVFYFIYKNHSKAALLAAILLSFNFFFGAIQDFFKIHVPVFSRYSMLLPAFFILLFSLMFYLHKRKVNFLKFTFFFNILLLIYLIVDVTDIVLKSLSPQPDKLSIYGSAEKDSYTACTDCKNPDIYFLLFDEYCSSEGLRQTFNYDNSSLDSFLLQRGFQQQRHSKSNYNFTPFSMASILNMNYIEGIKNINACSVEDYANCNNLIRNNSVIRFLSSRYYDIVNYSIFDLAGNPSVVGSSLLPVKTKLITEQTFTRRFMKDVGWHFYTGPFEIKWLTKNKLQEELNNNNKLLDLVKKETEKKSSRSRFIYAHFEMPHPPFYYDKYNRLRPAQALVEEVDGTKTDSYLGYLPYTNSKIKELLDTIQKNTRHNAVIILMGDHGYRVKVAGASGDHFFQNLNAVYFPDKKYESISDSITGVNQFRTLFNHLFKQSFPLLKDSFIFLRD